MKKISLFFLLAGMTLFISSEAKAVDPAVKPTPEKATVTDTVAMPEVKTMNKEGIGDYLTDANGMTLYWYKNDKKGTSNCSGPCLEKWPAFLAKAPITVSGTLKVEDFGTITRKDTKKQTTFKGYPLYYYAMDKKSGDTNGQNANNVWFVIDPQNFPPR
jgi:predicted lipoprotein with Yx(FWY)xxD motif